MTRPKLSSVLEIVRGWSVGTNVTISVSHNTVSVTNDGWFDGPYVSFVLGTNKRKSVKTALDALELLLVEKRKEINKNGLLEDS